MKFWLPIYILLFSVLISCDSSPKKPQKYSTILTRQRSNSNPHTFKNLGSEDCEVYAVLISSSKLARKLHKSKDWIVSNYQIPILADTISTNGRVIGHVPPGGHCFIVKQEGKWFFVQSPGRNELGWLSQKFVVGFVKKNPETLLPCIG